MADALVRPGLDDRRTPLREPFQRRLVGRLFGLPLFYKVLVANVLIILFGVWFGIWFTLTYVGGPGGQLNWGAISALAVGGFGVTILINAAVLRLALQPLRSFERAMDRVAGGDFFARPARVFFTDPDIERLSETLESTLDVLLEHRAQVQMLSQQVLAAQEDERKRIARELHDETAQSLTTLLIRLKMLERAADPAAQADQIREIRQITQETLEAVRMLAVELRPAALDDLGLVAALEAYADSYSERLPIEVDFTAEGLPERDRLAPEVELVLYRVVQEALTNVAKHAGATRAVVVLRHTPGEVSATIVDDGHGFNVDEVMRSRERGLGLFGMQERLALVQGHLDIESTPGRGTRLLATVPLPASSHGSGDGRVASVASGASYGETGL